MNLSRLMRAAAAVGAAIWIVFPAWGARPAQVDSPLPNPLDSVVPPPLGSPLPTPAIDPFECTTAAPCDGEPVEPTAAFETFLPGIGQPDGGAESQPAGPPPDLGALLNYAAGAVVVIGVGLKVYWFFADRRKASSDAQPKHDE